MWYDTGTDEPPESLSRRAPGEALGPLTRERLQSRLERHLPGKAMEPVRRAILLDADAYGAFLIERHARPPEHYWGPERGEDGGAAASLHGKDLTMTSDGAAQDRYSPHGDDEVTHLCPPEDSGVMPCCGQVALAVPLWHRLTLKPELVTCTGKDGDDD